MRLWVAMLSLVVVVGLAAAQEDEKPAKTKAAPKAKPNSDNKDSVEVDLSADPNPLGKKAGDTKEIIGRVSYGIGLRIGRDLKQGGLEPDLKRLFKGIQDAADGKDAEFTDDEITAAFKAFEPIAREAVAKKGKIAAEKTKVAAANNQKAGKAFLDANKEKDGVKSLPSGLQYKVISPGKGPTPKINDTVRVHYKGRLIDGTVFDQTFAGDTPTKRDQPAEFPVKGVIAGWTEALQKMKVGDKWQLFIPSELAYRENEAGPKIGPNSALVFEIELLEILE